MNDRAGSNSIAVRVEGVSKKYRLFNTPHDRLKELLHPFRKTYHHDFWALRDVSFEVLKGQTLGFLGRNGSGKSTLLQVIASVLEPTEGRVEVNGRVSALLELGAGFNPEFTGRENVIFSGVLNGFSVAEMRLKLPDIEAFADIGEFIDQPVKTYSSGMFARLAFAAAINIDADILIVDEILAVGDILFQEKCFRKIQGLRDQGKTIFFVSHNPRSLAAISDRIIVLDGGSLRFDGLPREAINFYDQLMMGSVQSPVDSNEKINKKNTAHKIEGATSSGDEIEKFIRSKDSHDNCASRRSYNKNEQRVGNGDAFLIDYLIVTDSEVDPVEISSGESLEVYIKFLYNTDIKIPHYGLGFNSIDGIRIYGTNTEMLNSPVKAANKGDVIVLCFKCKADFLEMPVFLNIGCSDLTLENGLMDSRRSIARLIVRPTPEAAGFVNLRPSFHQL